MHGVAPDEEKKTLPGRQKLFANANRKQECSPDYKIIRTDSLHCYTLIVRDEDPVSRLCTSNVGRFLKKIG